MSTTTQHTTTHYDILINDVRRRATVKRSAKGVRQGISIRLDGLSPILARNIASLSLWKPLSYFIVVLLAVACCVLCASTRAPAQLSTSSSAAEVDIDSLQPASRSINFRTCNQSFFIFDAVIGRKAASEN